MQLGEVYKMQNFKIKTYFFVTIKQLSYKFEIGIWTTLCTRPRLPVAAAGNANLVKNNALGETHQIRTLFPTDRQLRAS